MRSDEMASSYRNLVHLVDTLRQAQDRKTIIKNLSFDVCQLANFAFGDLRNDKNGGIDKSFLRLLFQK